MKQVENRWLVSLLVVVLITISTAEQVTISQPTDRNRALMKCYCHGYLPPPASSMREYFLTTINITLSSLRRQLNTSGSGNAVARSLLNGAPVWGLAQCRGYLSIADCLDCFDNAVNQLKVCELNGDRGLAIYTDCDVRYDDYEFYLEANHKFYLEADYYKFYRETNGAVLCDHSTSPQPTAFRKAAESLLLDLQIAAPRTTNFYAASTRKVVGSNASVYAIAECNLNLSHIACLKCLKLISRSLYDCLPTISGRAMYVSCFMRYDMTPFFGQNQQTDITTLLRDDLSFKLDSRKKRDIIGVIVGGVCSLLLACTFFIWSCKWKRTGRGQQGERNVTLDAPAELKGIVNYYSTYKQLQQPIL